MNKRLAALLLLLTLSLTACDISITVQADSTPTAMATRSQPTTPTVASAASPSPSNPDADLLNRAVANMKVARSFHLETTVNTPDPRTNLNSTDIITRDVDLANQRSDVVRCTNGDCNHTITILTDTYSSKPGSQTFVHGNKGDVSLDGISFIWDNFTPAKVDRIKDVLKPGNPPSEVIDGVVTHRFTISSTDLASVGASLDITGTEGTFDIWVSSDANPTVRQMKFVGRAGFWPFQGRDLNALARWSKFNQPFDIKVPTH